MMRNSQGDRWTEADVPAQRGRTAVITGANTGLGFETARGTSTPSSDYGGNPNGSPVSATPSRRSSGGNESRAGRYHHGDLKAALVDGAIELIAERGARGFSLAELSRRLGVTVAAPYRHFADRDELLAAVAVRALHAFADTLAAGCEDGDPPEQQLAAMARNYIRFAAEQRPLFDVVYATDLDKSRHPELVPAYQRVEEPFSTCVARLCPDDAEAAAALEDALEASARGHAALLFDGSYGDGPEATDRAAARAALATLALIQGFRVHAALQRPR